MDNKIKQTIAYAYPTAKLEEPVYQKFDLITELEKIKGMTNQLSISNTLNYGYTHITNHCIQINITPKHHPTFDDWIKKDSKDQILWIQESPKPFIVWHINVSLLSPFWYSFYNVWLLKEDTEYFAIQNPEIIPNELWITIENIVKKIWLANGYEFLSKNKLYEEVDFVKELEFTNDKDDDGSRENTSVGQCLFCPL